ncbi:MAG: fluoride efflux transporter CrcB [Burkholderiales bacterium]|jgi:CrcB protein|nr:fluoride efflux transporter CrcB [Burkholderiaceae bacterium]NBT99428.1 fluoride efflux transporter CrcB [Betaproteobacteria bacterium]NCX03631.1 fluoride efflux transporter CrcB [Betaproteobacteria bacterium]NDE31864.1 fluoride efflux transporter CrcB [Betaproteobacteria bacterium]
MQSLCAVMLGGSLGAALRWGLSATMNHRWSAMPLGTWLANLLGGFLVGVAVAWFSKHADMDPAWRLFVITGLLGGLTTFSSFSAEVVSMLQSERYQWALATVALHVLGSLLMTVVGIRWVEYWQA